MDDIITQYSGYFYSSAETLVIWRRVDLKKGDEFCIPETFMIVNRKVIVKAYGMVMPIQFFEKQRKYFPDIPSIMESSHLNGIIVSTSKLMSCGCQIEYGGIGYAINRFYAKNNIIYPQYIGDCEKLGTPHVAFTPDQKRVLSLAEYHQDWDKTCARCNKIVDKIIPSAPSFLCMFT